MQEWVLLRPEAIAQVDFLGRTAGDRFRHSTFVRLRDEKNPLEVVREHSVLFLVNNESEDYGTGGQMRKSLTIGLLTSCTIAILGLAVQPAAPQKQPGMVPYTPTRLEWLAIDLEASYHEDFALNSEYSLHYLPKPPNTVLIFVHYKSEAAAEAVNHAIDAAKDVVNHDASSHGWQSWVKIEVQRKLIQK